MYAFKVVEIHPLTKYFNFNICSEFLGYTYVVVFVLPLALRFLEVKVQCAEYFEPKLTYMFN
jgi:hypothetical protein